MRARTKPECSIVETYTTGARSSQLVLRRDYDSISALQLGVRQTGNKTPLLKPRALHEPATCEPPDVKSARRARLRSGSGDASAPNGAETMFVPERPDVFPADEVKRGTIPIQ